MRHVKGPVTGDSRKQIDEIQVQHGASRTKQEERHGWRVGLQNVCEMAKQHVGYAMRFHIEGIDLSDVQNHEDRKQEKSTLK